MPFLYLEVEHPFRHLPLGMMSFSGLDLPISAFFIFRLLFDFYSLHIYCKGVFRDFSSHFPLLEAEVALIGEM